MATTIAANMRTQWQSAQRQHCVHLKCAGSQSRSTICSVYRNRAERAPDFFFYSIPTPVLISFLAIIWLFYSSISAYEGRSRGEKSERPPVAVICHAMWNRIKIPHIFYQLLWASKFSFIFFLLCTQNEHRDTTICNVWSRQNCAWYVWARNTNKIWGWRWKVR